MTDIPPRLKLFVEFLDEPVESNLRMKFTGLGDLLKLKPFLKELLAFRLRNPDLARMYFTWTKLRFELHTEASIDHLENMYTLSYNLIDDVANPPPHFFIDFERRGRSQY